MLSSKNTYWPMGERALSRLFYNVRSKLLTCYLPPHSWLSSSSPSDLVSSSPSYYELLPLKCPSRKNQRFKLQGSINDCTVGHSTWTKKECKYKIVTFAALVLKLKVTIYCMWTTEGNTLQYQNYWIERWTSFPLVLKEESLETTGSCAIGSYNF